MTRDSGSAASRGNAWLGSGLAVLGLVTFLLLGPGAVAQGAGFRPHLPEPLSHAGYGSGCGAAVDSQGDLYAADFGTVHIYDTSGAEITSMSAPAACQLAVDSTGALYVQAWAGFGGAVTKYLPSEYPPVSTTTYSLDTSVNGDGTLDPGPTRGVAVNPATDDVYTAHPLRTETQLFAISGMTTEATTFTVGNLPPACASTVTESITYSSNAATRRGRIDTAVEKACSGGVNDDFAFGGSGPAVTFQGQFANQDVPQLDLHPGRRLLHGHDDRQRRHRPDHPVPPGRHRGERRDRLRSRGGQLCRTGRLRHQRPRLRVRRSAQRTYDLQPGPVHAGDLLRRLDDSRGIDRRRGYRLRDSRGPVQRARLRLRQRP